MRGEGDEERGPDSPVRRQGTAQRIGPAARVDADSRPTLQTQRADRTGTSAAASAPPSCDAEPWTAGRKRAVARRDTKDAAGEETACDGRPPSARLVLPDEDWAVRTLWDVENEDVNDRTYLFDAGPMDYQCGHCQAF